MSTKKIYFTFCFILLSLTGCKTTGRNPIEVVDHYYQCGKFNGSILIAQHERVLIDTVLGYRDLSNKAKLKKETPFYIASLSKPITAIAIFLLAERALLSLDDKAATFVESLPVYARNITIRQLINHTSGIADYENILKKKGLTNDDVVHWLQQQDGLTFEPGTKFQYSNSGYIILSLIIEKVSKMTYADFLKKNIFNPLQMHHTTVYEPGTVLTGKAIGYDSYKQLDDYSILTTGDGGIYSTAADLFRLDKALRTDQLLPQESTNRLYQTPVLQDGTLSKYGAGWFIEKNDGDMIVQHTGGLAGFRSAFWRNLTNGDVIIALSNQGDAFPIVDFLNDIKKTLK